jgi:single-strand DNA-binding protein
MFQNQGVNKVILVGHVHGKPQWKITGKEKCLCFQLITTESFNRNSTMQEHSEYHFLRIPEFVAGSVSGQLEEGVELYVEGKISTLASIDGKGIKRYDTSIVVSKFNVMAKSLTGVSIAT